MKWSACVAVVLLAGCLGDSAPAGEVESMPEATVLPAPLYDATGCPATEHYGLVNPADLPAAPAGWTHVGTGFGAVDAALPLALVRVFVLECDEPLVLVSMTMRPDAAPANGSVFAEVVLDVYASNATLAAQLLDEGFPARVADVTVASNQVGRTWSATSEGALFSLAVRPVPTPTPAGAAGNNLYTVDGTQWFWADETHVTSRAEMQLTWGAQAGLSGVPWLDRPGSTLWEPLDAVYWFGLPP